jgi:hypothetical protein
MDESHKPHRAPHSGAKAEKKKKAKMNGPPAKKGLNPKAHINASSRKAEKIARRSTEVFRTHTLWQPAYMFYRCRKKDFMFQWWIAHLRSLLQWLSLLLDLLG